MNASYSEVRNTVRTLRRYGYLYLGEGIYGKTKDRLVGRKAWVVTHSISLEEALHLYDLAAILESEHLKIEKKLHRAAEEAEEAEKNKSKKTVVIGPGETSESLEEIKRYLRGDTTPKHSHLKLVEDPKANESDATSGDND